MCLLPLRPVTVLERRCSAAVGYDSSDRADFLPALSTISGLASALVHYMPTGIRRYSLEQGSLCGCKGDPPAMKYLETLSYIATRSTSPSQMLVLSDLRFGQSS